MFNAIYDARLLENYFYGESFVAAAATLLHQEKLQPFVLFVFRESVLIT